MKTTFTLLTVVCALVLLIVIAALGAFALDLWDRVSERRRRRKLARPETPPPAVGRMRRIARLLQWPRTVEKPYRLPWFVLAWRAPWVVCAITTLFLAAVIVCFFQLLMEPSRVPETFERIIKA